MAWLGLVPLIRGGVDTAGGGECNGRRETRRQRMAKRDRPSTAGDRRKQPTFRRAQDLRDHGGSTVLYTIKADPAEDGRRGAGVGCVKSVCLLQIHPANSLLEPFERLLKTGCKRRLQLKRTRRGGRLVGGQPCLRGGWVRECKGEKGRRFAAGKRGEREKHPRDTHGRLPACGLCCWGWLVPVYPT